MNLQQLMAAKRQIKRDIAPHKSELEIELSVHMTQAIREFELKHEVSIDSVYVSTTALMSDRHPKMFNVELSIEGLNG